MCLIVWKIRYIEIEVSSSCCTLVLGRASLILAELFDKTNRLRTFQRVPGEAELTDDVFGDVRLDRSLGPLSPDPRLPLTAEKTPLGQTPAEENESLL